VQAALAIQNLERDATPAASLRISCAACDPDNPRSVPRAKCTRCRGTGLAPAALAVVVDELKTSRTEKSRAYRVSRDEDD